MPKKGYLTCANCGKVWMLDGAATWGYNLSNLSMSKLLCSLDCVVAYVGKLRAKP